MVGHIYTLRGQCQQYVNQCASGPAQKSKIMAATDIHSFYLLTAATLYQLDRNSIGIRFNTSMPPPGYEILLLR